MNPSPVPSHSRREFLSSVGKGLGLAALTSASVAALLDNLYAASHRVEHLAPEDTAMDEDFWFEIQRSFSITRGITNLNNGGVSPSPRIVTEALNRYNWQQEDVTAYTMWQILEPQCETIRTGLADRNSSMWARMAFAAAAPSRRFSASRTRRYSSAISPTLAIRLPET